MPFPRKLLNPGEEIAFELHPHWWYFSGMAGFGILILAGALALGLTNALHGPARSSAALALLGALVLGLLWFLVRLLTWRTTHFVLTTDRLILRSGVLSKQGREIPLERVMDLSFHQSLFERIVGTGTMMIESGGESGQDVFAQIPRPELAERQIYAQIENIRQRTAVPEEPNASIPEQIAQLARLRDQGIVTDAEFQTKKAELLARM